MGASVVTFEVGALPSLFGDHLSYAPFPPGAKVDALLPANGWDVSDSALKSDEAVDGLVETVLALDRLPPQARQRKRDAAMAYSRDAFSSEKVSTMWQEWLRDVVSK